MKSVLLLALIGSLFAGCENFGGGGTSYCTVKFDAQGGSPAPADQSVKSGGAAIQPADPAKDGHVFAGWYKEPAYTNLWSFDASVTASMTLYAKWTAVQSGNFVVSFDTGGGSVVADQSVASGGTATAPANPSKEGHTFDGWFKEAAGTTAWDFTNDTITAATTLYAKWTEAAAGSYAITYNLDGGANHASNPATYTIESGLITLGTPTKSGYDFGGWYDNSGLTGSAVTAIASGSTGAKTFWAKWTPKAAPAVTGATVTVAFTDGGATLAVSGGASIGFAQSGTKTIALTDPDAYASIQWIVDGEQKGTDDAITLNGADYGAGAHSLAIVVTKTGSAAPWSKTLAFTVTE